MIYWQSPLVYYHYCHDIGITAAPRNCSCATSQRCLASAERQKGPGPGGPAAVAGGRPESAKTRVVDEYHVDIQVYRYIYYIYRYILYIYERIYKPSSISLDLMFINRVDGGKKWQLMVAKDVKSYWLMYINGIMVTKSIQLVDVHQWDNGLDTC